jgi:hypothetical protein
MGDVMISNIKQLKYLSEENTIRFFEILDLGGRSCARFCSLNDILGLIMGVSNEQRETVKE